MTSVLTIDPSSLTHVPRRIVFELAKAGLGASESGVYRALRRAGLIGAAIHRQPLLLTPPFRSPARRGGADLAAALKVLADPVRLRILGMIRHGHTHAAADGDVPSHPPARRPRAEGP